MQFLYGSFVLATKHFFLTLYCQSASSTATATAAAAGAGVNATLPIVDVEVVLQTSLALMKAIFAMMMVDAEVFKQLASGQKASFLYHAHVLLVLVTKVMDYGKEGITDEALQPCLGDLSDEVLQQTKQWAESALQQLLLVLTLISVRDVEARRAFGDRHALEEASKMEEYMKWALSEPVAVTATVDATASGTAQQPPTTMTAMATAGATTAAANASLPSLFVALCHLPSRFFKASRTKHSVCTCIISACMELEHHVQIVRQAGRERYLQKFVEYMLREFDATLATPASLTVVEEAGEGATANVATAAAAAAAALGDVGDEDHRVQRQERVQRCLTLIPEEYWTTVIRLVWVKEQA